MKIYMRKLGIDYGDSRVGIAITDGLDITVQGLETIHHKGNDKLVLKRLEELLNEYEIDTFVIGMPINMNGTKTIRVEVTEMFIHKLRCRFPKIKIETIDERLTTVTSERVLIEAGVRRENRKKVIDKVAATIILQTYLDCHPGR